MTDFSKILDKAKELEAKMKESQEKIKNIKVQGISGSNSVKVTLNGEGEMEKIEISPDVEFPTVRTPPSISKVPPSTRHEFDKLLFIFTIPSVMFSVPAVTIISVSTLIVSPSK